MTAPSTIVALPPAWVNSSDLPIDTLYEDLMRHIRTEASPSADPRTLEAILFSVYQFAVQKYEDRLVYHRPYTMASIWSPDAGTPWNCHS